MSNTATKLSFDPIGPRSRSLLDRILLGSGGIVGALVILAMLLVIFSILAPGFLSPENMLNILRQYAVPLTLAVGQTLVIVTAGIDLSVAATAALSGVVMGVSYAHVGLPEWLAILLGLLSGFAVGAVNGFLITAWKVPDIIVTLGSLTAVRGIALLVTDGLPVPDFSQAIEGRRMPESVSWIGSESFVGVPLIIIAAAGCALVGGFILNRSILGRAMIAVGGNREAAHVSGIHVNRTRFWAYAISGTLAGIGGMLLAGRLDSANGLMANMMELDTIAAVVIGGTALFGGQGRVSGTVIGIFIIGVLSNGLNILGVSDFWQRVVTGVIIVLVVALDQWRRRVSDRI